DHVLRHRRGRCHGFRRAGTRDDGDEGKAMDLKNAAALVTGASCGIGFETARVLRERGARVAICARHQNELESAAKMLGALPIVADVSKEDEVLRMIETVIKEYDDYNVLVNNAGSG